MDRQKALANRARQKVREKFEFVPLAQAQFIWHHDEVDGEWKNAAFVTVPVGMMGEELSTLSSSTGADTDGWPDSDYNNPEFVFGMLLLDRWANPADQVEMVAEFAKIDSADWARRVLRGIAHRFGAFANEDDEWSTWDKIDSITDVERFRDEILRQMK